MSAEMGAALGDADIDDLYATIVEDLALKVSIVDPKGGARSLTVPIPAISFNAGDYADCPFVLIATGREAEIIDRLMSGVPWNNEEADHDPQQPSALETDMTCVAKIAGQARSHFKRKVKAAVLNQADLLRNEMTKEDETIAMTVIVRLKRGEIPAVTLEQASVPDAAWKQKGRS